MEQRKLGKADFQVSAITLGCMGFMGGTDWTHQEDAESIRAIRTAFDAGITSFDTAEAYGNGSTEVLLGKALGADRPKAVIASKISNSHLGDGEVIAACEASLRRLGTDYIDLYQIHWPNAKADLDLAMEQLLRLREQGKIRAIGVSNFGMEDLDTIEKYGCVVSNQMAYSLLVRGIEYGVLPKCRDRGIAVLTYSSLAQGLLSGKYRNADEFPVGRARTRLFRGTRPGARHGGEGFEEGTFRAIEAIREIADGLGQPMTDVAIAWLLAQPGVTTVIAGGRTAEQVLGNVRAATLKLSPDTVEALARATDPVKEFLGDNPDPWDFRIR